MRTVESLPTDFMEFWQAYPRRVGKADALKAWRKLKPDLSRVLEALAWQRRQWTDLKFCPFPATWLRGERWEDEPLDVKRQVDLDWFEDCKARHGGTCESRYQHGMRD